MQLLDAIESFGPEQAAKSFAAGLAADLGYVEYLDLGSDDTRGDEERLRAVAKAMRHAFKAWLEPQLEGEGEVERLGVSYRNARRELQRIECGVRRVEAFANPRIAEFANDLRMLLDDYADLEGYERAVSFAFESLRLFARYTSIKGLYEKKDLLRSYFRYRIIVEYQNANGPLVEWVRALSPDPRSDTIPSVRSLFAERRRSVTKVFDDWKTAVPERVPTQLRIAFANQPEMTDSIVAFLWEAFSPDGTFGEWGRGCGALYDQIHTKFARACSENRELFSQSLSWQLVPSHLREVTDRMRLHEERPLDVVSPFFAFDAMLVSLASRGGESNVWRDQQVFDFVARVLPLYGEILHREGEEKVPGERREKAQKAARLLGIPETGTFQWQRKVARRYNDLGVLYRSAPPALLRRLFAEAVLSRMDPEDLRRDVMRLLGTYVDKDDRLFHTPNLKDTYLRVRSWYLQKKAGLGKNFTVPDENFPPRRTLDILTMPLTVHGADLGRSFAVSVLLGIIDRVKTLGPGDGYSVDAELRPFFTAAERVSPSYRILCNADRIERAFRINTADALGKSLSEAAGIESLVNDVSAAGIALNDTIARGGFIQSELAHSLQNCMRFVAAEWKLEQTEADWKERLEKLRDRLREEIKALEAKVSEQAQWIEMLEDDNQALNGRVRSLEEAKSKAEALAEAHRYTYERVKNAVEKMPRNIRQLLEKHGLCPSVSLWLTEHFSEGRIRVLDSAYASSAKSDPYFDRKKDLLRNLFKLGNEYLDALLNGGGGDTEARKVFTPNVYAAQESDTTQNSNDPAIWGPRTVTYAEETVVMKKHLRFGVADDPTTLRVYFFIDQDRGKAVIGYCGTHPKTGKGR
ncbi:hypothetical protein [Sutterella sp.]|uniref:hypothetical protein n=1 Tax=Sutterella sp. TaxID=1981025 RepID=UPI0026E0C97C|nr:hypothetical protein [Sutterella sp.]MDO5532670.1 hypothetical protein [Sutterella sp.]